MTWKQVFISSVGKKLVMGLTGIFLILFLIVHAGLNACIWANDGGEMFLHAAHFMGGNWVPRILEIGLFVGFILHIYQGYLLTVENRKKRSVGYAVAYSDGSKWYSRSMGLLGTLILLFLIMHMSHFWFPNRSNQGFLLGPEINLYEKMKTEFSVLWVVIVYVIGCISLAYHLAHGFQSAFKTLGVHNKKYNKMLVSIGYGFSVIVPLVFAMMPISFYFKWIQ
ncbi:MAG: succinate dehydrogenase cytochrome b subunit [Sediminibacterium sp. Gen4]|jgi:succinate dehydrogenase / fumarate reductase, cytochrome b subunit|uniref:succinate dehydrogenase cytochrome b subunit n=1 Tax=unclassified Sediminibacterium TaxID=2635961 RepID=UPI0015BBBC9D|nr:MULTISPECIES: succinate dehydrogenase cytochrome b subunit [unclassified Sediminibacterium]MBW0161959.1 succinate dehydrogenase cytochrome b subunit [Sediminibacterium sp.]MBW0164128.1 succinate dehydrogenase cytochrome b subunit [Sediminibacterium sp.]NWK66709.1 succinate dehydrogenase cytochrome b subunit [Sediminibacterium sp. Gen4]